MLDAHFYLNADHESVVELPMQHGDVVVVSCAAETLGANQDSAAVLELDASRCLLIVADGMGGGPSGAEASAVAIRSVIAAVKRSESSGRALRSGVLDGVENAQMEVAQLAVGAATTLLVAEVQDGQVRTYHVGDSGALVFGRGGRLKLATDFHSPVGYAVKSGLLDEQEAMQHRDRHYVSNMVGLSDMSIEMGSTLSLARYDTLILGSDGLFDNLFQQELIQQMRSGPLPKVFSACFELARQRMNTPNVDHPSKLDDLTMIGYRRRC